MRCSAGRRYAPPPACTITADTAGWPHFPDVLVLTSIIRSGVRILTDNRSSARCLSARAAAAPTRTTSFLGYMPSSPQKRRLA
jgi:hypothetical protein